MSRDQRPGKMRVVGSGGSAQQRRRNDLAPQAGTGTSVGATGPASAAGTPAGLAAKGRAAPAAKSGKPVMLLALLFVVGCAVGGAALPLLGVL